MKIAYWAAARVGAIAPCCGKNKKGLARPHRRLKPNPKGAVLQWAGRGAGKRLRMSEILAEELPGYAVAALSGPSHAEEVAREMPTGCVAACPEKAIAEWVQGIFMNPSFRVYSSTDITGVELVRRSQKYYSAGGRHGRGHGLRR